MNRFLRKLASLDLAVALLLLVLLSLGTGTVLESVLGTDVAMHAVYGSWWLLGSEVAMVASALAAVAVSFPWSRRRIGFVLTHAALGIILVGALLSARCSQEGILSLWEGETGREIVRIDQNGRVVKRTTLPFAVRLDRFRIDHLPGTFQPAGFRSEVQLLVDADSFGAAIYMNHPFAFHGWGLFQSGYNQEEGRTGTVLLARRDPGQPVVFVGYCLLVMGLLVVLGTRMAQAKREGRTDARPPSARRGSTIAGLAIVTAIVGATAWSTTGTRRSPVTRSLQFLPVQHDGRVMPLDTLAREAVWKVTGEHTTPSGDPVADVLSWAFDREARRARIIAVDDQLAPDLGLPAGTRHASFDELDARRALLEEWMQRVAQGAGGAGWAAAAEQLWTRFTWMREFVDGHKLRCQPPARGDDWSVASVAGTDHLLDLMRGPRPAGWPSASAMRGEVTYNRAKPVRLAWLIMGGALLLSLLAWRQDSRGLDLAASVALATGFGVMMWGIAMRWSAAGRVTASNMYESLLFLGWGVGLVALVAMPLLRNRLLLTNAGALAVLTMLLVDLLPMDPFIHPMPPVLSGTPWLILHVPVTMVGYAVLALGVLIAHVQIAVTIFRGSADLERRVCDALYWYMLVGQLLLLLGIVTGSVWASSSWGRVWGWDPKEVWSLVAYLAYVAILHARCGMLLGPLGLAVANIVAFESILMTYLGVNFVLATGLHSYAAGTSPVARWLVVVALFELAFLTTAWLLNRRRRRFDVKPSQAP